MSKKTYDTPELTVYGTVENLTAGDGNVGLADLIAWLFNQQPDPFGHPSDPVLVRKLG